MTIFDALPTVKSCRLAFLASVAFAFSLILPSDALAQTVDLSLSQSATPAVAEIGDTVVLALKVNNRSASDAGSGIAVTASFSGSHAFVDAAGDGTFAAGTGIWTVGSVAAGDSAEITVRVRLTASGQFFSLAEISAAGQGDPDSTPGNGSIFEDDIASACSSVPFDISLCLKDTIKMTAPSGHTDYQWFKNGDPISGATDSIYLATTAGTYTFTTDLNPSGCAAGNCCPVILREKLCLGDLVWHDVNNDGSSAGETGLDTVEVALFKDLDGDKATTGDQVLIGKDTTDAQGNYLFANLDPGFYFVKLTGKGIPAGFVSSTGDGIYDNDGAGAFEGAMTPDPDAASSNTDDNGTQMGAMVMTTVLELTLGGEPTTDGDADANTNFSVDFGLFKPTPLLSLGDLVWFDANNDGLLNNAEVGLDTVEVLLFSDADGDKATTGDQVLVKKDTTDASGNYLFTGLLAGNYFVKLSGKGVPAGYVSSTGDGIYDADNAGAFENQASQDPDTNGSNTDDNGSQMGAMVMSPVVTLVVDGETGDGDADANVNPSVDFGLYKPQIFDLALVKTGAVTAAALGDTIDYSIKVINQGTVAAFNVQINDYLPAGLTFSAALNPAWSDFGGGLLWRQIAGPIAAGDSVTVTLKLRVDPAFSGSSIRNFSEINAADDDTNGANTPPTDEDSTPNATQNDDAMGSDNQTNGDGTNDSDDHDWADVAIGQPATLGNYVWLDADRDGIQDAGETGVDSVEVLLFSDADGNKATTGDQVLVKKDTTDADGKYLFTGLAAGNYFVQFNLSTLPTNHVLTTADASGSTDANDSDAGAMGMTAITNLSPAEVDTTLDAGIVPEFATLGDFVWYDNNKDGDQDLNEGPVEDVQVNLYSAGPDGQKGGGDDVWVKKDTTDADGLYLFENLEPGKYFVVFDTATLPANFSVTTADQGGDDDNDSDANAMGMGALTTLSAGGVDLSHDLGIAPDPAAIGNFVWYDTDRDGIQDAGETAGVKDVFVSLFDLGPDNQKGGGDDVLIKKDTTDAAGNYLFEGLLPGSYYVVFDLASLPANYLASPKDASGSTDSNDSDANAMGMGDVSVLDPGETDLTQDLGIAPNTATIGNFVWYDKDRDGVQDLGEGGVKGAVIVLATTGLDGQVGGGDDQIAGIDTTDASGFYLFTNVLPGDYYLIYQPSSLPPYYYISPQDAPTGTDATDSDFAGNAVTIATTLSAGENDLTWDLGVYIPSAALGNLVFTDNDNDGVQDLGETGIQNVIVWLYEAGPDGVKGGGDDVLTAKDTTDNLGVYFFNNLDSGNYYVQFLVASFPAAHAISLQNQGGSDELDSDANAMGMTDLTTLDPTEQDFSHDLGLVPLASIGNFVWDDTNQNGMQDSGEPGVENVFVSLFGPGPDGVKGGGDDVLIKKDTTDANGNYLFTGLFAGDYYLVFDLASIPSGYVLTPQDAVSDAADSDAGAMGMTVLTGLTAGENDLTWDAGIYLPLPTASIGNQVWLDEDRDGIQDPTENTGVDSVIVSLFDLGPDGVKGGGDDVLIAKDTTDANGLYGFSGLTPGDYYVQFDLSTLPANHAASPKDASGSTDSNDSDAGAMGMVDVTTLVAGENDLTHDLGVAPDPATLGDYVWYDTDKDGAQDLNETGVEDVIVNLFDLGADGVKSLDDQLVKKDTTDAEGLYLFENLLPGGYYVMFDLSTLPAGYYYTTPNLASGDDNNDSDSDNTGMGALTTLTAGEIDLSHDLGIVNYPVSVGNFVWLDADRDGIQDPNEVGVEDVFVSLFSVGPDGVKGGGDDVLIKKDTTDANGHYWFKDLLPGNFYVQFDLSTIPTNHEVTLYQQGGNTFENSDANAMGMTAAFILISSEVDSTIDMGIAPLPATLGNFVWYDDNRDGIQDPSETAGVEDVIIYLNSVGPDGQKGTNDDFLVKQDTTDANGLYLFSNLLPGSYYVQFEPNTLPYGYIYSPKDALGSTDANDSDANAMGMGDVAVLDPNESDLTHDLGIMPSDTAVIGDFVWFDNNNNGIQDPSETAGVEDVIVYLFDLGPDGVKGGGDDVLVKKDTTDALGFYLFTGLLPDSYYVQFDLSTLPLSFVASPKDAAGSTDSNDSDANTMGMTDVTVLTAGELDYSHDLGISPLPASLGNYVWLDSDSDGTQDPSETTGVADVIVSLFDLGPDHQKGGGDDVLIKKDTTDANGLYLFSNLAPGSYYVQFDLSTLPLNYLASPKDASGNDATDSDANAMGMTDATVLTAGEVDLTHDLGVSPLSTALGNFVWIDTDGDGAQDGGEPGVEDVIVSLYGPGPDGQKGGGDDVLLKKDTTDANGIYGFSSLLPGNYYLVFDLATIPSGFVLTGQDAVGDATDSDANAMGMTILTNLTAGENDLTWDAGIYLPAQTASIGNQVWLDTDRDGIKDPSETTGVQDVIVSLFDLGPDGQKGGGDDVLIKKDTTDSNGIYGFSGLAAGNYYVQFNLATLPANHAGSPKDAGMDDATDSDANAMGMTDPTSLSAGENDLTHDLGVSPNPATLGDFVWFDNDKQGDQDVNEAGVEDVIVNLFWTGPDGVKGGGDDFLAAKDTTDVDGLYLFEGLMPGNYYVMFDLATLPAGYFATSANQAGGDDENDSDADATGMGAVTNLSAGEVDLTHDLGIINAPASLGNFVWLDEDRNGIQDPNESGVEEVIVNLFSVGPDGMKGGGDDILTAKDTTDANGLYWFSGLLPGSYYVQFDLSTIPANHQPTLFQQGGDPDKNSDANAMGMTLVTMLLQNEIDSTLDFGIAPLPATLGDLVFLDQNGNGIQDLGDGGVEDVIVHLFDLGPDNVKGGGDDVLIARDTTDAAGNYLFTNLTPGDYYVQFVLSTLPANHMLSPKDAPGATDATDSDANAMGMTDPINLGPNETNTTVDLGIVPTCDLALTASPTDATCGNADGAINVTATGGTPTITFLWNGGQTTEDRTGLAVGLYKVTATDANGCKDSLSVMIMNIGGPTATWTSTNSKCTVNDGTISVTVSGGTPGYSFLWADGPTSEDRTGLGAGLYKMTITDANDCQFALEQQIQKPCGTVGNFVWYDQNGNGQQDGGTETGVENVQVSLFSTGPNGVKGGGDDIQIGASQNTSNTGAYLFTGLDAGEYFVVFNPATVPSGYEITVQNTVGDALDSDADAVMGMTTEFQLSAGGNDLSWDMGVAPLPATIGNFVWFDNDRDGVQDPTETAGVPMVTVNLVSTGPDGVKGNGDDFIYATDPTDGNGFYLFEQVPAGEYFVQFVLGSLPTGYQISPANAPMGTAATNSDANLMGMTVETTLVPGETDLNWDLGINPIPAQVGNFVWNDDGDGVQEMGEMGVSNVHVYLYGPGPNGVKGGGDDIIIKKDTTDSNGFYGFSGIEPGNYYVLFDLATTPANTQPTLADNSGNDATDSDANAMGMTPLFNLTAGESDQSLDLGITPVPQLATLGNLVWLDQNGDGDQDGGETTGVQGVIVSLFDAVDGVKGNGNDVLFAKDTTDAAGLYLFQNIPAGNYYVQFNLATLPAFHSVSPQDAGGNDALDSDASSATMGMAILTNLSAGEIDLNWDLGITPPTFDLALTKKLAIGQTASVAPGGTVDYTITVINQGQAPAYNIEVTDYVPTTLTYVQADNAGWAFSAGKATTSLSGPIAPLSTAQVTLRLRVPANSVSGAIVNSAEISKADNDNNPNNNPPTDTDSSPDQTNTDPVGGNDVTNNSNGDEDDHDPETITVTPVVNFDLALRKKLGPGQQPLVQAGSIVHYQIEVINQGNAAATDVVVTDSIPAGLLLQSGNGWVQIGQKASQTIPSLAVGATVTLNIYFQVPFAANGDVYINIAEISAAKDPSGNPANDVDSDFDSNPKNDDVGGNDTVDNENGDEDDHDYEVIIEQKNYDPLGAIYCDKTGKVVPGGLVTVTGPGQVYFTNGLNGSNGYYQWHTDGTPGVYTMTYSHPTGFPLSSNCLPQPGAFDPTGQDGGPIDMDGVMNGFIEFGVDTLNGFVVDADCAVNPYFLQFSLEAGDPEIHHNNLPISCTLVRSIVCEDINRNDQPDPTDPPLPNVTVHLLDCNTLDTVATTISGVDGKYQFDGLEAGDYLVAFQIPAGTRPISGGTIGSNGQSTCVSLNWGECDTVKLLCLFYCPTVLAYPPDTAVCWGNPVQLYTRGGDPIGSYSWLPTTGLSNPNISNPIVTSAAPAGTTTYTVTYDDGLGCKDQAQVTVTINEPPYLLAPISIAPSNDCNAPNGAFFADGTSPNGPEYSIDGGQTWENNGFFDQLAAGTYTLLIRDAVNLCQFTPQTVVIPGNPPLLTDGPDSLLLCEDQLGAICISTNRPFSSYFINSTTGYAPPTFPNDSTICTQVSVDGAFDNFEVTFFDADGCAVIHTVYIIRIAKPESDFVVIEPACDNDVTCFKFTGSATNTAILNWNFADGVIVSSSPATATLPAGANVCVRFPSPGFRMTMLEVNDGGCTDLHTEGVNIKKAPTANGGPDQTICLGNSATLVGTSIGGIRCWWEPTVPLGGYVPDCDTVVSPLVSTNYVFWTCDGNGCKDNDTVRVNVLDLVADAGPNQTICAGGSATLTATSVPPATAYLWSTGATTASITVSPATTTTYYVTVTAASGCTDVDSVRVNVNPRPTVVACADKTICGGSCVNLVSAGLPLTSTFTFLWSNGATLPVTQVCPTANTTYYVTLTDQNGCTAVDTVEVFVNPIPNANAGPDQTICAGASATLTATGGTAFLWSTGATTASITVSPAATTSYFVTVTDAKGCTDRDTVVVNIQKPTANAGPDQATCQNGSAMLMGSGGVLFNWSNGVTTAQNSLTNLQLSAWYVLTVTDAQGCTDIDSVYVTVYPNPTANAGPDQTICAAGCVNLSASGGVSYIWVPNTGINFPATANPKACVTGTTTYTVYVTDANGCIDDDQMTINVLPTSGSAGADQSICAGTTATLTATGGASYSWSTGAATASITVAPVATTTYQVTITSANGCTLVDQVVVTVLPVPTANAGADQTICNGASATLTATGGVFYQWSTGATTVSITVSPAVTTTYTVTVTNASGCTATDQVTITISNPPLAYAGADATICPGGCINLTATGGASYLWSTGAATANIQVCPPATTTYTVTATDANGCSDTDDITITVAPATANAGPDQAICAGSSATLTASGGGTYLWSNGATTASISVSPAANTTYTVTVTNGAGCTATDQVVVNVLPVTTVTINPGDVAICEGSQIMLMATGGFSSYLWGPTTGLSSTNSQMTLASPTATTTYTVTATAANGCTSVSPPVTVTIKAAPDANAGADQTVCAGACASLLASGGGTYLWSNGATTAATQVCPSVPTVYIVTVTSATNACTATDFVLVNTNGSLTASAGPDQTVCTGGSATLTATGGTGYLWSNGATTASITVTPATTTTYTVTISNGTGCTGTDQVVVTISAPTVNAGADQTICAGASATLTATGGTSYLWSNGATTASITVTPASTTNYTVTATGAGGCTAVDGALVTISTAPIANAGADQTICTGQTANLTATGGTAYLWNTGATTASITVSPAASQTFSVTVTNAAGCTAVDQVQVTIGTGGDFTNAGADQAVCAGASATLTATGGTSYVWSNGATTASTTVSPASATVYTVTATNAAGCTDTDQVLVTINAAPAANAGADQSVCANAPATLTATGGVSYLWSTGATTASTTVNPAVTTTYTVTATNAAGCTDTDQVTVSISNALNVTASVTPTSCGNANGAISLTVTGGSGNYGYAWSPSVSTTATASNLAPMAFSVTITDQTTGCTRVESINVPSSTPLTAMLTASSATCTAANGSITVGIAGGSAPYTVAWAGPQNGSQNAVAASPYSITGLLAGNYSVTVTGANGCSDVETVTVNQTQSQFNVFVNNTTPASCNGGTNGVLMVMASAAAQPFDIFVNNVLTIDNATSNPQSLTGLTAGTYNLRVVDANGCEVAATGTVNATAPPTLTAADVTVVNPKCFDSFDGSISSIYTVQVFRGATLLGTVPQTLLNAGAYRIVRTQNGCSTEITVNLTGPAEVQTTMNITTQANCCGTTGGAVTVSTTGGTGGPYTYQWSNGLPATQSQTGLAAGIQYRVTVTDANGCTDWDGKTLVKNCDNCADIVNVDTVKGTPGTTFEVCLPLSESALDYYDIFVNGAAYTGNLHGCNYDSITAYSYAALLASGPAPYRLDSWTFGGGTIVNRVFNTMQQLRDSMQVWDGIGGGWVHDVPAQSIVGGNLAKSHLYGSMKFTNLTNWITSTVAPNFIGVAQGASITIPGTPGKTSVVLVDPATCCRDTVCVILTNPPIVAITPETRALVTPFETSINDCVDLSELSGAAASINFCDAPNFGTVSFNGLTGCLTYSPAQNYSGLDQFCVVVCDANGVCDTTFYSISVGQPACSDLVSAENVSVSLTDCSAKGAVCVDIPAADILSFSIKVNGSNYAGTFGGCDFDTTYSYLTATLPSGAFVAAWTRNGTTLTQNVGNIAALVNWMNNVDAAGNWQYDASTMTIRGGVSGSSYGPISVNGGSGAIQPNIAQTPQGTTLEFAVGANTVIFEKGLCKDTLVVNVTCPSIANATVNEQLFVGQTEQLCLTSFVTNGATIVSATNTCAANAGTVDFAINTTTWCVTYTGAAVGQGQSCWTVTLSTGQTFVVTLNVSVTLNTAACNIVTPKTLAVDLGNCATPFGTVCVDVPIAQITNYNILDNGAVYGGTIQSCNYNGAGAGSGTQLSITTSGQHQFIFVEIASGCRDTLTVTGNCQSITPQFLEATIYVADVDTVCLDISDLPGKVISVENACSGSGEFVIFDRIAGSLCYVCTGLEVGVENVCFVLCDDKGFCDTTYMKVNVLDRDSRVEAIDDRDTTITNTKIVIDIIKNDKVPGAVSGVQIIRQPLHGLVIRNADNTLTYLPNQGFCDENTPDVFEYVVCNAVDCDTAMVRVIVLCDKIRIYTGFSPNFDLMNDFFVIEGIHNYPNNELTMFDRWGTQIYQKNKYDNSWDGTFEGRPLPDGTYFFIFDDGEGTLHRGYVQIHR